MKQAIVVWVIVNLFTSIFLANAIVHTIEFAKTQVQCKARGEG